MRRSHLLPLIVLILSGCSRTVPPTANPPVPLGQGPTDLPGLHNVCRIMDKLYSGSAPEGEAGFRSLQEHGFHTIISVDGSLPDIQRAHAFGLRYVHLPIGYDGVPREQALKIARAVRDLPGLVYLHCHHGKHRGPAAAVAARRCLDPSCTVEDALAHLKQAGTATQYVGLYAAAKEYQAVSPAELDRVSADFHEEAKLPGFVSLMVEVDMRWDRLKQVKAAGWKTPPGHPDVDPAHEARLLREAYREAARLPEVKTRPDEFRKWLGMAEDSAAALEAAFLATKQTGLLNPSRAETAFEGVKNDCNRCHAKYRDVREKP
jgi:protein tyrosine phosphatase (PTP) superfamily phosphohydrolase (DUF442 family)